MPKGIYIRTEEHNKNVSIALKNRKLSKEHKENISKNHAKPMLGRKHTKKSIDKIKIARKKQVGINHPMYGKKRELSPLWKTDNVSDGLIYNRKHNILYEKLGKPSICENCGTTEAKVFDWANVSGEYKDDFSDWVRLCRTCHVNYDSNKITVKRNFKLCNQV